MGGPLLASVNGVIASAEPFLDFLRGAAVGFAEMDEGQRNQVVGFALMAAGIGPVIFVGGKLLKMTASLVTGYRNVSKAIAIQTAASASSMAITNADTASKAANISATYGLQVAQVALTKATNLLKVAWATNPLGVAVVALTALVGITTALAAGSRRNHRGARRDDYRVKGATSRS